MLALWENRGCLGQVQSQSGLQRVSFILPELKESGRARKNQLIVQIQAVMMIVTLTWPGLMPREHAPNIKTQVGLMQLRKNAERNEIERRSQMNESVDIGHRVLAEIRGSKTHLEQQQAQEIANAKEVIFRLVRKNAAFSRTLDQLTKAWGPAAPDQAQEEVDNMLEKFVEQVEGDQEFTQTARQWTEQQVTVGPSSNCGKIRRRKPR